MQNQQTACNTVIVNCTIVVSFRVKQSPTQATKLFVRRRFPRDFHSTDRGSRERMFHQTCTGQPKHCVSGIDNSSKLARGTRSFHVRWQSFTARETRDAFVPRALAVVHSARDASVPWQSVTACLFVRLYALQRVLVHMHSTFFRALDALVTVRCQASQRTRGSEFATLKVVRTKHETGTALIK